MEEKIFFGRGCIFWPFLLAVSESWLKWSCLRFLKETQCFVGLFFWPNHHSLGSSTTWATRWSILWSAKATFWKTSMELILIRSNYLVSLLQRNEQFWPCFFFGYSFSMVVRDCTIFFFFQLWYFLFLFFTFFFIYICYIGERAAFL